MPRKRRLLLIDSSDSARSILFKELTQRSPDLDIVACADGKEAMTAARRYEFEIITTGIDLPDTDGYQLVEQIRQTPKNRDTAIFVVSGDTDTRVIGGSMDDTDAVTAYFDKAEGHKTLVNFIINYLGTSNDLPLNVLYVDKSATSIAITTGILDKHEIDYRHFRDAEEAIESLRADLAEDSRCSYDVMITDMMLTSKINGFELIKSVRNDLGLDYLSLPILLMTIEPGEDERTDFTAIFGAGTNDFITKPVGEDDLLARLQTLVNIKRQSEALNP
jgi:two-component system cell cycle response regulator